MPYEVLGVPLPLGPLPSCGCADDGPKASRVEAPVAAPALGYPARAAARKGVARVRRAEKSGLRRTTRGAHNRTLEEEDDEETELAEP